jgi:TFIIF-interacting CTD phosphatase-like protein
MKYNLFLDLDETLIHCIELRDYRRRRHELREFRHHIIPDSTLCILERKGVHRFLDAVRTLFNVSVWTAASQSYAAFVMKYVIQGDQIRGNPCEKTRRKLHFGLSSYHCALGRSRFGEETCKDLRLLAFMDPSLTLHNTIILDDHEGVYATQPGNCVAIRPFNADSIDNELLHVILPRLIEIARTGNIKPGIRIGTKSTVVEAECTDDIF